MKALTVPAMTVVALAMVPTAATAMSPWVGLVPGPHRVGYTVLDVVDHSRTTGALTTWDGVRRESDNFRVVRISVWYPAVPAEGRPVMDYLEYVEAAGFATAADGKWLSGAAAYIAHAVPDGVEESRLREVLASKTTAYRDAPPRAGDFPVIVYAPSFSYEPFENAALFEYLAAHGYVVASSRSSGPETREMSSDHPGVEASVRDLETILTALHDFGHADLRRIGAAGFSWGGLSAAMLAMRNHNVRAVLALDGTFEHADLPSVRKRWDFEPRRMRGGYLAIVGDRQPADSMAAEALYADFVELRYPALSHWDFASDMIRIYRHSRPQIAAETVRGVDAAFGHVARQALLFFDGYLKDDSGKRAAFLAGGPEPADDDGVVVETLTSRAALPAPPSVAEFTLLLGRDVGKAVELLDRVTAADPEIRLLDWSVVQDTITTSPFETKLAILDLMGSRFGESSIYFNNLGQAWRLHGDADKALAYFRRALEHNPDSGFARRAIAELEKE